MTNQGSARVRYPPLFVLQHRNKRPRIALTYPRMYAAFLSALFGRSGTVASFDGGADSFSVGGGSNPPVPPVFDYATLVFSALLVVFGFYLLYEATKTLKWLFPEMPEPGSGSYVAVFVSVAILVFWSYALFGDSLGDRQTALLYLILYDPSRFTPGLLLASLVPNAFALFKLSTVIAARPTTRSIRGGGPRAVRLVLVQGLFALLNVLASVVTLYRALGD